MELSIPNNIKLRVYQNALLDIETRLLRAVIDLGLDIDTFDPATFDPDVYVDPDPKRAIALRLQDLCVDWNNANAKIEELTNG